MKQRELARLLGITPQAVSQLAQRGMPTDSLSRAQRWRRRHLSPARMAGSKPGTGAPPASLDEDEAIPPDLANDETYRAARAAREQVRLEKEALELRKMRVEVLDAKEAARIAYTAWRGLRDAIQSVPARIANEVASESDAYRCEQIIAAALDAVLLSFDPAAAVRDNDDDEDDDLAGDSPADPPQ